MQAARYFGRWKLLPELCKYDVGGPPAKAFYSFTYNQPTSIIDVAIDWTDTQGKDFSVKYQIELGKKKLEQMYGVNMQVYHELSEKGTLDSTSYNETGDKVLMRSYREVKGERLQVVMETPTQKGVNRIFQIYQKQA